MTICTSPGCTEAGTVAGKFSQWCESHAAILHHVAAQLGKRRSNTIRPAATKAARAELDQTNAKRLAAAVHSGDPVDQIAGLHHGSEAWDSAVALAQAEGWIKPEDGRLAPGDNPPARPTLTRRQKAIKIARIAHGRGSIRRDDAAEAVGCAATTASRLLQLAVESGWITRVGAGPAVRYVPTDAPLPTD